MAAQDDKKGSEGVGFAAFCLFSFSFCLYALSSSAAIGWLDSPEFVAQAASLGVAHSPGHPLPALLGRLASLLPVGDLVWRINLMSSVCAAAAVTLLYAGNLALLGQLTPELSPRSRKALAFIVALLAGPHNPLPPVKPTSPWRLSTSAKHQLILDEATVLTVS